MLYRVTVDVRFYSGPNPNNPGHYVDFYSIGVKSPLDNTVGNFKKWFWDAEITKVLSSGNQIDLSRTKFCRNSYNDPALNDNERLAYDEHIFAVMYKR